MWESSDTQQNSKTRAVRQVVDRGYSVKEVAARLGVSSHSLYKWVKAVRPDPEEERADELLVVKRENLWPDSGGRRIDPRIAWLRSTARQVLGESSRPISCSTDSEILQVHSHLAAQIRIFPSASYWLAKLNVRRRELPVVYDFGRELVFEAQVSGVPPDAQLARVVEREIDGLAIKTTMTRDAETLRAHASGKLSKTRFDPSEFRSLRKAYRSLGGIGKVGIWTR